MKRVNESIRIVALADIQHLPPDFLILAWSLISFQTGLVHRGSMKNLLGDHPSPFLIKEFSAEEWVNEFTPETFLVHAQMTALLLQRTAFFLTCVAKIKRRRGVTCV